VITLFASTYNITFSLEENERDVEANTRDQFASSSRELRISFWAREKIIA